MTQFGTYNRIAGISDQRRLPRVGKIRLGVKLKSPQGREYPSEVSYFVVRDEDYERRPDILESFRKRYGEKPVELDIMFPVPDEMTFFPQSYKKYGGGGLRCKGDGVTYTRIDKDTGEVTEGECPHPEGCSFAVDDKGRTVCKRVASLVFLLPTVTWGGVFQIDTTSFHSIVDINSAIDYCRQVAGRIHMIPLKLRREARETQFEGKKATHYTMTVALPDSGREIIQRLEQANKVRGMFDIFQPAAVPQIQAPSDGDIPEDLYPKDVVAETKRALPPPPPAREPAPPPRRELAQAAPTQAEQERQLPPNEPPAACVDCQSALGPRHKKVKVGETDYGRDLVVCAKCAKKREDAPPPAPTEKGPGDAVADEMKRQRAECKPDPAPAAAPASTGELFDDFDF